MSPPRPKPSEIAAEAKRIWMPYIWKNFIRDSKTSYLYPDAAQCRINLDKRSSTRTRVAVMEGDPVNYALGWYQSAQGEGKKIPVVNMANEKRAGGDWESGLMAPEECFARRSNLVHALTMPWNTQLGKEENFYPLPQRGGIYSPEVCMFKTRRLYIYLYIYTSMHLLIISSCFPRGTRPRLRCLCRSRLAARNIRRAGTETKARRNRDKVLVCAGKRTDEGEDASGAPHRILLWTPNPCPGCLWPWAHFPQSICRSREDVETASIRGRGVPWRVPGHCVCHRQQHGVRAEQGMHV